MLELVRTKRTDPRILKRMEFHYSQPKGFVGRNRCYAVIYNGDYYGHIVGGSATKHLPGRDEFLNIDSKTQLNNVVNNIFFNVSPVFDKYPKRNFTSYVVRHFVDRMVKDWEDDYGDKVLGFETLVEKPRTGDLYLKAGWVKVGVLRVKEFQVRVVTLGQVNEFGIKILIH